MVNVLVIAYGEPVRLNREIRLLSEWMHDNDLGMVREIRILDIPIHKEDVEKLRERLKPTHPSITKITQNKFVKLLLKTMKYTPFHDLRMKDFHSPNFNVIGIRQDKVKPDGRESVG